MTRAQPIAAGLEPWMTGARFRPGDTGGLYESYYLRGNHPDRPLAFWIRYTVFVPKGRPGQGIGELWAVVFDGETGRHTVAKEEHPISEAALASGHLQVDIAGARLTPTAAVGAAHGPDQDVSWDLTIDGAGDPLLLLQRSAYDRSFPAAKSFVLRPQTTFRGRVTAAGRELDVDGWRGSLNHNWGSRHTDYYAFGQVAGFDNAPDSFLEVVSARVRVGPLQLPMVTCLSLRHRGRTYELTNPVRQLRGASAQFGYFYWRFETGTDEMAVRGELTAQPADFVALNYYNPPGGIKHCLNTKIAACTLTLTDRRTGATETLTTQHRALFEILTDHRGHGVTVRA